MRLNFLAAALLVVLLTVRPVEAQAQRASLGDLVLSLDTSWVHGRPAAASLLLRVHAAQRTALRDACLDASETWDQNLLTLVVRGRRRCTEQQQLSRWLGVDSAHVSVEIPLRDCHGIVGVRLIYASDTTRLRLIHRDEGHAVEVLRTGRAVEPPAPMRALAERDWLVNCDGGPACKLFIALIGERAAVQGGSELAVAREDAFRSLVGLPLLDTLERASMRSTGIYLPQDPVHAQALLNYAADFSRVVSGPSLVLIIDVRSWLGQRWFCRDGECRLFPGPQVGPETEPPQEVADCKDRSTVSDVPVVPYL